jgi:flavin-dependent dehydrogenase
VSEHEVVIVGGGPAGVATALFFAHAAPARAGSILLLEKERYPREKYCAGGLGARADALLGSIGVRVDVPSVWINAIAFRAMGETQVVREPGIGRVIRRIEFDHALARVAEERGIELRTGVRVLGVERTTNGFELETSDGPIAARVVVGADGVQSVVRRALGFSPGRWRAQALEVDTEPVESDLPRDVILFDVSHRELPGYYWDFPTLVDGREMVVRGVYLLRRSDQGAKLEIQTVLEQELAARGLELGKLRKKRFAELAFDPHAAVSRPGVLLVGEAAGIDPVTGEGIAQALFYGATAGRYLAKKLAERDHGFEDWAREIRRHHVGRDLLTRTMGVPLFYGAPRPYVERYVLDTPDFIRVGAQHFGGKRWTKPALARAGWGALRHGLRYVFGKSAELVDAPAGETD